MRHSSFSTTEKHYVALRSAQSAVIEVAEKLARAQTSALVGGTEGAQQFSAEELMKLKSLLKDFRRMPPPRFERGTFGLGNRRSIQLSYEDWLRNP